MAFKAADMCMQIHGGIALTTDLPIEKFWRQRRSFRITEGATEVMKMVIARHASSHMPEVSGIDCNAVNSPLTTR